MSEHEPVGEMTLVQHLTELRTAIVQSLLAAGLAAVGAWFLSEPAVTLLIRPAIGPVVLPFDCSRGV